MSSDVPDFTAARDHVLQEVVRFARVLRQEGVDVPANATLPAVEALVRVGLDERQRVRVALETTLVTTPRDVAVLDEYFPEFWYRLRTGLEATATTDDVGERTDEGTAGERGETTVDGATAATTLDDALEEGSDDGDGAAETEVQSRRVTDSSAAAVDERSEAGQAGTYSADGTRGAIEDGSSGGRVAPDALRRFERALATLSGRRWTSARDSAAVDARRALRESLGTGGVALSLPRRERDESAFRTCVLVDVSQSVLDAIDRPFLLSVLEALVRDGRSVRVFFFDTDIREVTDVFADAAGDPASALAQAEITWGGGTQIGASLTSLRERWPYAVDRRTVTLVISDGLDVGDVGDLEAGMTWLARQSRAVVWLNPLAATKGYEPTCRGMATALPYVDGLFAFAGNDDVAEIARQLDRHGTGGPVGYEFDSRDRTGEPT